ncbi:hypothetical protein A8M56_02780 [Yersinia pestis]|nr:hypothetical protein A8M56_02780 [Yersinia pestis]
MNNFRMKSPTQQQLYKYTVKIKGFKILLTYSRTDEFMQGAEPTEVNHQKNLGFKSRRAVVILLIKTP